MPYFRDKLPGAQLELTALYPVAGRQKDGITTPPGKVLDGPNPYLGDQRTKYGPNGYLVLELNGPTIRESYRLPNGTEILTEELR